MATNTTLRFSLGSLFWLVAAIAFPLGLATAWTAVSALLVCSAGALVLWIISRRPLLRLTFFTYLAILPLVFLSTILRLGPNNPYVREYNERMEKLAKDAGLVGEKERVTTVLGAPTSTGSYWNTTYMDTGQPTPDAEYWTTYNYAPYWFFPYAKFQVHCRDGKVQSIELYDD